MKYEKLFLDTIADAEKIVITTHLHPDADGIGSEIALCMALLAKGKKAICVNEEPLLERYKYLDPTDLVMGFKKYKALHPDQTIDLLIVTDTNALHRIGGRMEKIAANAKNILFIDHHPCPKELAALHCIDTNRAATGELVGHLIEKMKIPFTKEMALALYTSIVIDTSSFRYPTVTSETHALVSKLLATGIQPPAAYNMIYGTKKISHMRLLGAVLSSAQTNKNGSIAWLTLTDEIMQKYNGDTEDTHAFINHLLILDNIKVACMFREQGTSVKVSLRSAGDIDVGVMAQAIGGGGHNHSAATVIDGSIEHTVPNIIKKIEIMLEED